MKTYKLKLDNKIYQCRENETLLEAFIRQGVELPFSCRKGSCQACMMQCVEGTVSDSSQKHLRKEYIRNHYFLPCSCIPVGDMSLAHIAAESLIVSGLVHAKEYLSDSICKLRIEPAQSIDFRAGQYVNLIRDDGLSRPYSLAGLPDDYYLEFHIKRMRNGVFSNWVFDQLQAGDALDLQGPFGNCFYHDERDPNANLVLIGKSTGFAPLTGILRDALSKDHAGNIHAWHLGDEWQDIYNGELLKEMASRHDRLDFYQGLYKPTHDAGSQDIVQALAEKLSDIAQSVFYMAGSPAWLASLHTELQTLGVADDRIFTDPYELNDLRQGAVPALNAGRRRTDSHSRHDAETGSEVAVIDGIWEALDQGKTLSLILQDFYTRVYADQRLSPFFHNTTRQRSIEKQFLFLRQKFTGEKVYFGDRPRNAHHWMVITDELFDYRKSILLDCMRKFQLEEKFIESWLDMEESFRKDIVKSDPWPKIINGVEMPLNGYEVMTIDEGTLCDGCQDEISSGQTVRYHVRLGLTYCEHCMGGEAA